ncbi:1615_t:CDS:2 [Cetraspora pellucida]|uniref:1615_t:CDS:1 n=1 Tax=Cetraspora pellucida TaxID=1433469 RepID=A0A9N8ZZZ4_9GLOM|nr:1615_t:CDS:2 [Cetraspora pellucida]
MGHLTVNVTNMSAAKGNLSVTDAPVGTTPPESAPSETLPTAPSVAPSVAPSAALSGAPSGSSAPTGPAPAVSATGTAPSPLATESGKSSTTKPPAATTSASASAASSVQISNFELISGYLVALFIGGLLF